MTLVEIKNLLSTTGIPVAYRCFPEGDAPDLPFICFLEKGSNNLAADGSVYHTVRKIDIELYTKNKDTSKETLVETALSGLFWNKTEEYLDDEQCYQLIYELEV